MLKYQVNFSFRNDLGYWINDFLNNDGKGFTYEDAKAIAKQLIEQGCRYVSLDYVYYLAD